MVLKIRPVDVAYVQQTWPLVSEFIADALEQGEGPKDYNSDHIRMFLSSGQWVLLVAVDDEAVIQGAATISLMNYPMSRIAFITAIGGKFVINKETAIQLRALLTQYGATKIQAFVRPSMERLLTRVGFFPRTKLVEATL